MHARGASSVRSTRGRGPVDDRGRRTAEGERDDCRRVCRQQLFTTPKGCPVRQTLFYARSFKPAAKAALPHKPNVRFHDLRHTCVALLVEQGAHPKLIQTRLGHSSITVTLDRYGHVFPSMDAQLADALEVAYQSSNGNVTPLRAVHQTNSGDRREVSLA